MIALDREKGFTLIEMLISICIMAIAFAGLATMQIACINGNAIAGNLTNGITLAQDYVEYLNSLDIDDPLLDNVNTTNDKDDDMSRDCSDCLLSATNVDFIETGIDAHGDAGGMYTRICNVSAINTPVGGAKTVVAIVIWKNHRVSVSSVIGET